MLEDKLSIQQEKEIQLFLQDIEEQKGIDTGISSHDIITYLQGNFREDVHYVVTTYGHFALPYSIDKELFYVKQRFNKYPQY